MNNQNVLNQKPVRAARGSSKFLALGVALLLLGAGVSFYLVRYKQAAVQPQQVSNNRPSGSPQSGSTGKGTNTLPGEGDPQVYWDTIKITVADGLGMSVDSVASTIRPPAATGPKGSSAVTSVTIGQLATQQGMLSSQRKTLEQQAVHRAVTALVNRGSLSQSAATQRENLIDGWDQENLDGYIMYAFDNH